MIGKLQERLFSQTTGNEQQVEPNWITSLTARVQRRLKFDLASFADEARQAWESGVPVEHLAERFGCSPPTAKKAIEFSYERAGSKMPTRAQLRDQKMVEAPRLRDAGIELTQIAEAIKLSIPTVRKLLKRSFAAEGKTLPDGRRRKSG